MKNAPSLIVVLAEDQQQQQFVRRFLYRLGYGSHDIRFEKLPLSSGGAGEQWVRQRYATAVQACRLRSRKAATCLVVIIDADKEDVAQRNRKLEKELTDANIGARKTTEAVTHLVPKRNIETWVLCLNGTSVNEERDYKQVVKTGGASVPDAASAFYECIRPGASIPAHWVPSLQTAIPEAQRVPRKQ